MKFTSITIVGHTGKMGRMFSARWANAGYAVHGVDREPLADGTPAFDAGQLAGILGKGEVVVLCVPVSAIPETLALVVPHLRPDQVLADITSVKTLPMSQMEQAFAGAVVGTHPLFGPTPNPEDMRVAITPGKEASNAHCVAVERLFTDIHCTTFRTTPQEHDRGVGFAQSLNFAVCASFFATLAEQPSIEPFLTPSFKRLMEAARKHLTVDTAMFCEFTGANPQFAYVVAEYDKTLAKTTSDLASVAAAARIWYEKKEA